MKRSKHSGIADRVRDQTGGDGLPSPRGLRKMGINEVTFYNWKKKYGGLEVSELRRLKNLDKQILQDVLKKSSKDCSKTGDGGQHAHGVQYFHKPLLQFGIAAHRQSAEGKTSSLHECWSMDFVCGQLYNGSRF